MLNEARRLTVSELLERLVEVRSRQRRCEYELACLLVAYDEACGDAPAYALSELGLERRQTCELLRIGRALPDLPSLQREFAAGRLGWTQAREVIRVAVPETDEAWTDRALSVPMRRLEREVAASVRGALPPDYDDDVAAPDRVVLRFEMSAGDALVVRKAMAVLKAQAGEEAADEGVLLAGLARVALRESHSDEQPMPEERYRVVIERCPDCGKQTHVDQGDGRADVSAAVAAEADCDHETLTMEPGPARGRLTHALPPALRRAVMHRDGYRCVVPGCANATWIDVHHIVPRSEGGRHTEANTCVLCTLHHRMTHVGHLLIERAEDGTLHVERLGAEPALMPALMDVLEQCVLDTDEVARYLGVSPEQARALLARHERRGAVQRTPEGAWCRLVLAEVA